ECGQGVEFGVVLVRRRGGHRVDEITDVVFPARGLELALPRELLRERERIYDTPALTDRHHRAEDPAMALGVEHRVVHQLSGVNEIGRASCRERAAGRE